MSVSPIRPRGMRGGVAGWLPSVQPTPVTSLPCVDVSGYLNHAVRYGASYPPSYYPYTHSYYPHTTSYSPHTTSYSLILLLAPLYCCPYSHTATLILILSSYSLILIHAAILISPHTHIHNLTNTLPPSPAPLSPNLILPLLTSPLLFILFIYFYLCILFIYCCICLISGPS